MNPNATQPRSIHRLLSWSKFLAWLSLTVAGKLLTATFYLVVGGATALLILGIVFLNGRDDLSIWHTVVLEEEFTTESGDATFADYLAREERLFSELGQRIYAETEPGDATKIHRYYKGSRADPTGFTTNWNRTFEFGPAEGDPKCGVLLLHGMSDSPYSMRALAGSLRKSGAHVIGLRLPGHGTVPSGLLEFTYEDMDAAVKLAMRHLSETVGDLPLYLVGYSNGGALSVHYTLESLENESLPQVSRVVLISPEIGVTSLAAFAVWQGRIGHWLGLEKLAWNSISAEYDPYKYNSFAVNAGDQAYQITKEIGRHLDRLSGSGELERMPPILAFQSAVDATVSVPALIEGLFAKLPGDQHELVLFDLNRVGQIESFLQNDPREHLTSLIRSTDKPFSLTVLANRAGDGLALDVRHFSKRNPDPQISDPGLSWPAGIYSLTHVALPFPPDDPLYGNGIGLDKAGAKFQIGNLILRGEKGALRISPVDQLRLRWNPFFSYLEERVTEFTVGRPHP
jgi:alpha-beta hydrolase superfamily lysophospholipase